MNKPSRLLITVAFTVIFALTGLIAAFTQTTTLSANQLVNTPDAITILVPKSTSSVPFFLLAENSIKTKNHDVKINVKTFINHAKALAMLLRGDIQFLYTGTSQGWENRKNGGPIVMIDTGVWGVSYLIANKSYKHVSISGFEDLAGKNIALPFPGSPLDFQTRYILLKKGLDPDKDLNIVYAPFSQTIPRLLKGQIDFASLPEPLATSMEKQHDLVRIISYREAWAEVSKDNIKSSNGASPQVSLFTTENISRKYPELIVRLVSLWRTKSIATKNNPFFAAQKTSAGLSLPADIVSDAIKNTYYEVPDFTENISRVKTYFAKLRTVFKDEIGKIDDGFFFKD